MRYTEEHLNLTEDEKEDFEERAAIIEYCGKIPRQKAEEMAMEIIIKKRKN